ncbi:CinA family protein [Nesterenkonia sp. F]|uniref:CinA family protein n=1 Tax=Nesterenkonia sp. F TaxID=795955 RepID=UPI000255CA13|nr:CinA family protein [Nesterenkonia sp. F]
MSDDCGPADVHPAEEVSAAHVIARLDSLGLTVAAGESLTAGAVAARLADPPGASAVLRGGVVAYCNPVKRDLLDVDAALLEERGAVDADVAAAMALGAARRTGAVLGVATTGVAGPEPHQGRPVGTVYIGLAWHDASVPPWGDPPPGAWTPTRTGGAGDGDAGAAGPGGEPAGWSSGAVLRRLDGDRDGIRAATVQEALRLLMHRVGRRPSIVRR